MTWINTYTGRKVFPLKMKPEDVCLEDVAHALAGKMRYAGHNWVSVAQHSIAVARAAEVLGYPKEAIQYAFLHDVQEAYLPDLPRPLKKDPRMAWFLEIEDAIQLIGLAAFGVAMPQEPLLGQVHALDILSCVVEAKFGFKALHADWKFPEVPPKVYAAFMNVYMRLWTLYEAEKRFLEIAKRLDLRTAVDLRQKGWVPPEEVIEGLREK